MRSLPRASYTAQQDRAWFPPLPGKGAQRILEYSPRRGAPSFLEETPICFRIQFPPAPEEASKREICSHHSLIKLGVSRRQLILVPMLRVSWGPSNCPAAPLQQALLALDTVLSNRQASAHTVPTSSP